MKIGVIVPSALSNPLYRAIGPMQEMMRRGHDVDFSHVPFGGRPPAIQDYLRFDVVYVWQLIEPDVRAFVKRLQQAGVAVMWDSDDDVTSLPKGARSYDRSGGFRGQRIWRETQAMIRAADLVTTTSEQLAGIFRRTGQTEVHVIENYLLQPGRRNRSRRREVVVGWVAAGEHAIDAQALSLNDALGCALEQRSDLRVETVGIALDLPSPRYHRHEAVPLTELPGKIERWTIGIAPLADTQFNRARSNVKIKEYAAAGLPWLASPVGPYAGLGEEQGGRLVADDGWTEAVVALVGDRRARKRLGANAARWAATQTLTGNADRWERVLERALELARERATPEDTAARSGHA